MEKTLGIVKNNIGSYHYEVLPENTRVATKDDFYLNGMPIPNKPYLIYSYLFDVYDCYRVRSHFPPPDFDEFLNDKRVYVFINNK